MIEPTASYSISYANISGYRRGHVLKKLFLGKVETEICGHVHLQRATLCVELAVHILALVHLHHVGDNLSGQKNRKGQGRDAPNKMGRRNKARLSSIKERDFFFEYEAMQICTLALKVTLKFSHP